MCLKRAVVGVVYQGTSLTEGLFMAIIIVGAVMIRGNSFIIGWSRKYVYIVVVQLYQVQVVLIPKVSKALVEARKLGMMEVKKRVAVNASF